MSTERSANIFSIINNKCDLKCSKCFMAGNNEDMES